MNIKELNLKELNPAVYNPRIITEEEFEGLKKSLEVFGQQENLIVNKNKTIISGHQRYQAMLALGWEKAFCNVVELDEKTEKKLNVIMNSQAITGKFDDIKLLEILEELKLDDDYSSLRLNIIEPLDLSEIDYSVLDDEELDKQMSDMADDVRKAIVIEFSTDDYPIAYEIIKDLRKRYNYIGKIIIDNLQNV